jgi:soluble lytic murein transglycosylase-like protein
MTKRLLLAAAALLPAAPAAAADAPAPTAGRLSAAHAEPSVLSPAQRSAYREIFAGLRAQDWTGAAAKLDALPPGPLHSAARAELYLAKGSPKVELDPLLTLIAAAPDMPQAPQLARLAETRGATELPPIPEAQKLIWVGEQPRRARARTTKADTAAVELEALVQPMIKDDQPAAAESLLAERELLLTPEARTEFQQRIAWSHYLVGNDLAARQLADKARLGTGEWALHAEWVAGLAAWRTKDCQAASDRFGTVAARSGDTEMAAAGHYWAARADTMCGKPERVQARLRNAARLGETFYGLLASGALGIKGPNTAGLHNYRDDEWSRIAHKPNVKAAIALVEIGERSLADQYIKHQVRIGDARDHDALIHLASDLSLASTQFWLAHNAPRGASVNFAARYPMPDWKPMRGWRVDRSLVFAHALQESNFRTEAVSHAGAYGVMQVRPGTAGDIARARGDAFERDYLADPAVNIEYGQSYLEYLRDDSGTSGLLPKVIAAYNAGPVPIAEWNTRQRDGGDPLLYIESIPYWETRGYVPIILRNYWIYEQQAGKESASRKALSQGLWPRFPGLPGAAGVRLNAQPEGRGKGGD